MFFLRVFQLRAQYPLDLVVCPLANATEAKRALRKAITVVVNTISTVGV